MNCDEADRLAAGEPLSAGEEEALGRHLASCPGCCALAAGDEAPADALVRALAATAAFRSTLRRGASVVLAASILLAGGLALLPSRPASRPAAWTIEGDETGVVLAGPGVLRRGETLRPAARPKGARS